jgi:D-xylonolactonase
MADEPQVRCVADVHAVLGEGPVWVERDAALYWVDIKGRKIFRLDEADEVREWPTPFRVGALAPRETGGFIAATDLGFAHVDPEAGRFEVLVHPEADRPSQRFNDGKVDRSGNFWAGTMDDAEREASGALYRLDPHLGWTRIDEGYRVTNGPAFSPDGRRLYHNDSAGGLTYVFDIDQQGDVRDRRILASYGEADGHPDGMTVDSEGCLWVAFWDGWCLRRLSPAGERLAELAMPVQKPTSCAFGGPAMDRLYITSASIGLDREAMTTQPYAGGLFMTHVGVAGIPERPFAG